jgi:coenzyme F420-reducing hydrogenase alpha subunit
LQKKQSLIEKALEVKSAGNKLSKAVAGRSVHAIFSAVGGYTKIISNQQAKEIFHQLKHAREHALEFVDLFKDNLPLFERKTHFVALKNEKSEYIGGEICSFEGYCISPQNFLDYLNRVVVPYSQATAFEFAGREYMVGALARMSLNKESLHKNTKKDCASAISMFPSNNIYMNNLAQAIEIVRSLDRSIEILECFEFNEEKYTAPLVRAGAGIGVLEAPRGTLYYALKINDAGLIEYINLVIPTAQNHQNMEKYIAAVVQQKLDENLPKESISFEAEKIIRAYDPCMSCATHFLKLKIKEDKIKNKSRKTKKPINPWTFKAEGKL